jgi:SAM-dependent methyltransferase
VRPAATPRRLVEDARLVQAGAWLYGFLRGKADGVIRIPLDVRGRQDPASDVATPDWPGPPDGDETQKLLSHFVEVGWLEAVAGGGWRARPHVRPLLAAMPLFQHVRAEDFVGRTPWLRSQATGRRVLDAGCGVGAYVHHFHELGARSVIGVDQSADRLAVAAELAGGPSVRLIRGSVEQMPLADRSVDLVFSRVVLPYVHQQRTMAEIGRVLAAGGRALLILHAAGFYRAQLAHCGLRPGCAPETYRAAIGLAGGLAFSTLGVEPRWPSRRGGFRLSYQTRGSFARLAARSGLRLDHWEENGRKPIAWLSSVCT